MSPTVHGRPGAAWLGAVWQGRARRGRYGQDAPAPSIVGAEDGPGHVDRPSVAAGQAEGSTGARPGPSGGAK